MKRWKSTVLLLSFLTIVFVGCVAVLLIAGEPHEDAEHVPLHPSTSSSYPNSSTKSSRSINVNEEHSEYHHDDNHNQRNAHHDDHQPRLHEHRHNYRKRFTDAIKGVFSDLINSTKNSTSSSTLSSPTFEEHLPRQSITNKEESTENNSSRLKRQLDFGSSSSEEQTNDGDNSKERYMTTQPSAKKYTPLSRRPFLRVIKTGGGGSTTSRAVAASTSSSSSSSPPPLTLLTTSSEEGVNSSEERNSSRGKFRKNLRRYRPLPSRNPKLQSLSSKEKYDVSQEEQQDAPRKNFTLEVVQVERKVVRKEDGNIPPLFKKSSFNIEPRLLKVTKKEDANRPQVVYKRDPKTTSASPSIARPSIRKTKSGSLDVSKEKVPSVESSAEKDGGSSEDKPPVVVNLHQQTPYNDHDLSAEDLKDYHDGHSTFGSKGNFTHTIISRNVAGFVPNESAENLSKRTKSDRQIVIEKGRVTERYPESPFENPSSEIYAVPGGRSSSTENSAPKQEVFPFTRTTKRKGGNGVSKEVNDNDRTSPAIPSSLAELYRKGHPGVVPAPKQLSHRSLSEPFDDESAVYSSPFRYDPLVDDPPLKFDPESDRFYGEPIPDNKERVAQSNSPVHVENRDSPEEPANNEDYFRPRKRESEEDKSQPAAEDDQGSSKETPSRGDPNDRFYYGRTYNPPDYAAEYEADPVGEGGNTRDNDRDNFDFIGLDDNFGPGQDATGGVGNDFFDFPEGIGGVGGGRGGGSRFKPRTGSDEHDDVTGHRNKNEDDTESSNPNGNRDYDEGHREERPVRRPPPPRQSRRRNPDSDYDANNDYGFGPTSGRNIEDDEAHPNAYDNGFIQTLQQFDEEIKKLQDEERQKLLDSTPHPEQVRSTEQERSVEQERSAEHDHPPPPSTTNGYSKEPPLIITSPGPLEPSFDSPPGPATPINGLGGDVGTTIRVGDEEDDDDVTEANPFISSREPTDSREEIIGDTTLPNRSVGAEEEEEDTTTHKGFGPGVPDYSTESSREVEDEK